MGGDLSVVIAFDAATSRAATVLASEVLSGSTSQVILAGPGSAQTPLGVQRVVTANGRGHAVRAALPAIHAPCTLLLDPGVGIGPAQLAQITEPVISDSSDVVLPKDTPRGRLVDSLARGLSDLDLERPLAPVRAVRTSALRSLNLISDGAGIMAEILVKLAAQSFRFSEISLGLQRIPSLTLREVRELLGTLFRYAFLTNDADNAHHGYNTLARLEAAPRYNAWLGAKLRPHLGRRVLEVGAGIGTMTSQFAAGRERVVALEADPFYALRLSNLFRNSAVVVPIHSTVEETDWSALAAEKLDSVLLSNVLEHIEDDAAAIRRFRSVLPDSGRLVLLVPALPALYGTLDEAVGHYRRYRPETIRRVVEENGFDVEQIEWVNLLGIAGWFLNGKLLRRRVLPALQLRLYDRLAPILAKTEQLFGVPLGLSLLVVARAKPQPGAFDEKD